MEIEQLVELENRFTAFISNAREMLETEESDMLLHASDVLSQLREALKRDIESNISYLTDLVRTSEHDCDKVNLFSILKIEKLEDLQTNFIAWLLDPLGSHDLGDTILNRFLEKACLLSGIGKANDFDASRVAITTQKEIPDVGIADIEIAGINFVCVIENKVLAGETMKDGIPQTKRYADYYNTEYKNQGHCVFIYLVPRASKLPASDDFKQMLYSELVEVIRAAIENSTPKPEIRHLIEMFIYNIEKEIYHQYNDYFVAKELLKQRQDYFYKSGNNSQLAAMVNSLARRASNG
mgnify:CR=1 FL=1